MCPVDCEHKFFGCKLSKQRRDLAQIQVFQVVSQMGFSRLSSLAGLTIGNGLPVAEARHELKRREGLGDPARMDIK
jgi:hypothetical protein